MKNEERNLISKLPNFEPESRFKKELLSRILNNQNTKTVFSIKYFLKLLFVSIALNLIMLLVLSEYKNFKQFNYEHSVEAFIPYNNLQESEKITLYVTDIFNNYSFSVTPIVTENGLLALELKPGFYKVEIIQNENMTSRTTLWVSSFI